MCIVKQNSNGIYTNLGIKPVYARPYNARAKVIERFFKEFQEEFEKLLPTYIGSSIKNKPAHLKRNEKFHKELYDKHSFINWVGGKRLLRKKIEPLIPKDILSYLEVFGGGAWVLLYKDKWADLRVKSFIAKDIEIH